MKSIIGNSGLIGKTLKEKIKFDFEFNSQNINEYSKQMPDGCDLYLSCLPATKWIVNKDIKKDLCNIHEIIKTIQSKKYNKVFLFSTIDVYSESPLKYNENDIPNIKSLNYGSNRYLFEMMVRQLITYEKINIFRLPALFNKNIKKNILFDLINNNNIEKINKNSCFQWYYLDDLHKDIEIFSETFKKEELFNLFPEPIDTKDILDFFPNSINKVQEQNQRIEYDFKSKHFESGYIKDKKTVLKEIYKFINEISNKQFGLG